MPHPRHGVPAHGRLTCHTVQANRQGRNASQQQRPEGRQLRPGRAHAQPQRPGAGLFSSEGGLPKARSQHRKIQKQDKMTRDAARLFKREIQEASGSGCAIKRKKTALLADAPEPVQSLARGSEPRMGWPIKAFAMPQNATFAALLLQPFRRPGMPASDSQSSAGHAFTPLRHRPPGLHPAAATRLPAQPHRWRADPRLKQALQAQRQAAPPWLAQPHRGQTPD